MRILIEKRLDLDLRSLIDTAAGGFADALVTDLNADELFGFMMERLRVYYLEQDYEADEFAAVLARQPRRPLDFDQRLAAVRAFRRLPESASLAAANKRIRNILRKAETAIPGRHDQALLQEPAEQALAAAIGKLELVVSPLFENREYTEALRELAALQAPVDRFFDDVMVMSDDTALRDNRLALLNALSDLFLQVADISRLQG